jgi:hypothetical protein
VDVNVTDRYQWVGIVVRLGACRRPVFGSRFYLREIMTSLSVLGRPRDGFIVENRPQTDRFGASATSISRERSLLAVADYTG